MNSGKLKLTALLITVPFCVQAGGNALGLSVSASTNGVGGGIYWNPLPKVRLALSYETISLKEELSYSQQTLDMKADLKFKSGGAFVTAGYQVLGWLYGTLGCGINSFSPEVHSLPVGEMEYGDITLNPEVVGDLKVKVKSGTTISPYIGIGFGKQSAYKKRVAASLEVGTYYMGSPKLEVDASGMLTPTQDPDHVSAIEERFGRYRLYPVVKLSVSVKLF